MQKTGNHGAGSAPPPSGNGGGTAAGSDATCGLSDFQAAVLARVNQWRASGANCGREGSFGPAPALAWNDLLTRAALGHSQDMAAHNFFDHTGSDGSTLGVNGNANTTCPTYWTMDLGRQR